MPSHSSHSSSRRSHASSSSGKNDVYIGNGAGGSSSHRSKYVQEKKWFCAWCHFGPLDWTYDTHCLECGRARDQYCRIEYRSRKTTAGGSLFCSMEAHRESPFGKRDGLPRMVVGVHIP
ncbi:hypothetical protein N8I77_010590 [Diaporthe amygdali]|uniref:Uncharacterized protein n=1 Tax=Phomopsis amygdali TaxID=1214568 RepID=A0AAD9W164_PHOAM|nr:hypothetical protein N8I77_010590 [Diaporthe amygdali]